MSGTINILDEQIRKLLPSESSGHDIRHMKRVYKLALHIQKEEEQGDKMVIALAAFLHDVHRIIQKETGKYCSPRTRSPR